jgi:hypothetical protein
MTMTRPDIAFSVSQDSQFCENPGNGHWNGVKRILAYLAGTSHFVFSLMATKKKN